MNRAVGYGLAVVVLFAGSFVGAGARMKRVPAPHLPAASLAWGALDGVSGAEAAGFADVLYVIPTCRACDTIAIVFARARTTPAGNKLVVSGSSLPDALTYARRLRLESRVVADPSMAFARAANIQWVPTLIRIHGGRADVTAIASPSVLRRRLVTSR